MITDNWVREFIYKELSSIVLELNRRNIDDVATLLAAKFEQKRYTVMPTYLSDEMYLAQQQIHADLDYTDASNLYTTAILYFVNRSHPVIDDCDADGSFW